MRSRRTHACFKLHAREPRDPVAIRRRKVADRREKAMSYKAHARATGSRAAASIDEAIKRRSGGRRRSWREGCWRRRTSSSRYPLRTPSGSSGPTHGWRVRHEGACLGASLQGGNRCALVARALVLCGWRRVTGLPTATPRPLAGVKPLKGGSLCPADALVSGPRAAPQDTLSLV